MVLVTGDNVLRGRHFQTGSYLREICSTAGMRTVCVLSDRIKYRQLMTKRHKTAATISTEQISIMVKD